MKKNQKIAFAALAIALGGSLFVGCKDKNVSLNSGEVQKVDIASLSFPLKEKAVISGLTSFPANTESDPNNRTIFRRLQEKTNVEVKWTAIQSDQWNDKITLAMANPKTLADFVFNASFNDSSLLKYADQGIIIPLEGYIDSYMPNLKKVFDKYPEYRAMCTDTNGHIWGLPWIEQLGSGKEAIQVIDNMSFINKKWLDFLGLDVPKTVEEFENVLLAFKANAEKIQRKFSIDGSIIPMSFIMNDGGQDPYVLINGLARDTGTPTRGDTSRSLTSARSSAARRRKDSRKERSGSTSCTSRG